MTQFKLMIGTTRGQLIHTKFIFQIIEPYSCARLHPQLTHPHIIENTMSFLREGRCSCDSLDPESHLWEDAAGCFCWDALSDCLFYLSRSLSALKASCHKPFSVTKSPYNLSLPPPCNSLWQDCQVTKINTEKITKDSLLKNKLTWIPSLYFSLF